MIKAVLFDLGGVFFEDGTEKFLRLLSQKTNKSYEELYPIFREGKSIEYRENTLSGKEFFAWASQQLNSSVSAEDLNNLWVSQYTEISGMRDIVLWLKSLNIKTGILSDNVPERIEYLETKYHFLDLFDDVVLSYEVNLTKNTHEIFDLALSRLNLSPKETVFIDDRQPNLELAQETGIIPIQFEEPENLRNKLEKLIEQN